jgi:cobalamin biosynthesis Co2+ chelatase CbiK
MGFTFLKAVNSFATEPFMRLVKGAPISSMHDDIKNLLNCLLDLLPKEVFGAQDKSSFFIIFFASSNNASVFFIIDYLLVK